MYYILILFEILSININILIKILIAIILFSAMSNVTVGTIEKINIIIYIDFPGVRTHKSHPLSGVHCFF